MRRDDDLSAKVSALWLAVARDAGSQSAEAAGGTPPLTNNRSSQRFGRPAWQSEQTPHGAELAATARSPSRTPRTPAPTAATVPASS